MHLLIAVMTPLILGSSDLWLASKSCQSGCGNIPGFDGSVSSTFKDLLTPFNLQYGSGLTIGSASVSGTLASDVVQMAGFQIPNQVFAVVNQINGPIISTPVSGRLGLAFQPLSASNSTPFWQALAGGGSWTEPLMSFVLTR